MTLRTRNLILMFATLLTLILSACLAAFTIMNGQSPESHPLVKAVLPLSLAVVGLIGFFWYFRKVSGPHIFFFFLSLFSLSFESSALVASMLQNTEFAFMASVLLTRVQLFGFTFGALCLFTTSLYSSGVKYQNQGVALILLLGISYLIANLVPVVTGDPPVYGIFPIGEARLLVVMFIVIVFLSVANFLRSWVINQNPDEGFLALAVAAIMLGRWLMYSGTELAALVSGSALLLSGAFLYSKKVFEHYLWY